MMIDRKVHTNLFRKKGNENKQTKETYQNNSQCCESLLTNLLNISQ